MMMSHKVEINDVFQALKKTVAHVFDIYYALFWGVLLRIAYGFLLALFGICVVFFFRARPLLVMYVVFFFLKEHLILCSYKSCTLH